MYELGFSTDFAHGIVIIVKKKLYFNLCKKIICLTNKISLFIFTFQIYHGRND